MIFARLALTDVFGRSLSMGNLGFWLYGVTLSQTLGVFSGDIEDNGGVRRTVDKFQKIKIKIKICSANQLQYADYGGILTQNHS
jgi:hypothetical protein